MNIAENRYLKKLVDDAVTFIDNNERESGLSKKYTSGRSPDGMLDGTITSSDIQEMLNYGEWKLGYNLDTLIIPEGIWLRLLRTTAFQPLLLSSIAIMPTNNFPYDNDRATTCVLAINSNDIDQKLVARSVKVEGTKPTFVLGGGG